MINEYKYGQSWKVWPSPLSLSLYSTFKKMALNNITYTGMSKSNYSNARG